MRYAPALAAPFLPPFLPPFVPPFLPFLPPFLPFLPFFLPVLPPFLPSPLLAPVLPFPSGAALANCVEAPPRIRPRDRTELSTHRNIVHLVTGVKKTRSAGLTEQCLSNTTPPARFRCLDTFSSLSTPLSAASETPWKTDEIARRREPRVTFHQCFGVCSCRRRPATAQRPQLNCGFSKASLLASVMMSPLPGLRI